MIKPNIINEIMMVAISKPKNIKIEFVFESCSICSLIGGTLSEVFY